jgi:tetratricopeptide (TPR) repeat protein
MRLGAVVVELILDFLMFVQDAVVWYKVAAQAMRTLAGGETWMMPCEVRSLSPSCLPVFAGTSKAWPDVVWLNWMDDARTLVLPKTVGTPEMPMQPYEHSRLPRQRHSANRPPLTMAAPQEEAASKSDATEVSTPQIFPPEEERQLLHESNTEKASANKTFTSGEYNGAIQGYEKALAVCPTYLEYDMAVLRSNIAACHLKLAEWKQAVESATQALEALDRIDPPVAKEGGKEETTGAGAGAIAEIDDTTELYLDALTRTGHTINDVHKLRTKALLRRAKARHEVGGWSSLQGSLEDYQALSKLPHQLSSLDQKAVQAALRRLPGQLDEAKNTEMADMMGKLKQLGNGILKPFGLSTENFQFTKDEKSGGYSMNFNQAGK